MRVQSLGYDEGLARKVIENKASLAMRTSILSVDNHSADDVDTDHSTSSKVGLDHGRSFVAAHDGYRLHVQFNRELGKKIVIVEGRIFLRECIQRSIQSALSIPVEAFSSMSEFDDWRDSGRLRLLILSLAEGNSQEGANPLGMLSELAASAPIIVLSPRYNFELMRAVIGYGAKGYIPMTMGFQIAIEAVRFVLAGGTYVPAECLLFANSLLPPRCKVQPRRARLPLVKWRWFGRFNRVNPTRLSRTS